MERKRILLLLPTFADEGGTQKVVCELGALLAHRYEVFECSFDAFNEPHVFRGSNPVLSLEVPRTGGRLARIMSYRKMIRSLRALKRKHRIDVTISNLWGADLINALAPAGEKRLSIAHINIVGNYQNRLMLRLRKLVGAVYRRFDKLVAVNQYLADEWRALFGLSADRVTYVNNFIADPPATKQEAPARPERMRLVTVGRLHPIKNQEALLDITAELHRRGERVQLLLCGGGPAENALQERARSLGLSVSTDLASDADVLFAGFVAQPFTLLRSADLFLTTSRSEGFGLVIAEAMQAGLPVLAGDCPTGGPHVILQGPGAYREGREERLETPYGFLMPVPDGSNAAQVAQWADTISELLHDPERRRKMSAASVARAADFSRERAAETWFTIIDNL